MRICLDISTALAQNAGIGRYTRQLALALHLLMGDSELLLFHNRQPSERLPVEFATLTRSVAPLDNKAWRLCVLAGLPLPRSWSQTIRSCDVFHGPDVLAPAVRQATVITIHDLTTWLFPQHHTLYNRLFMRMALPVMTRRSAFIMADSEATRQDILRLLKVEAGKAQTVYPGVDHTHFTCRDPQQARQRVATELGIRPPYILALGTLEPRKNLTTLLKAYAHLDKHAPQLVLAGARGWGDSPLFRLVEQLGLVDRTHFTGFVNDALLPDLYAAAEMFVYPSLYEGFGLPVLEAMACGAPVISSTTSSLPEVAGAAGLLIDPYDAEGLADAIRHLLDAPTQRERMREQGLRQAARFSWSQTAVEAMKIYARVNA